MMLKKVSAIAGAVLSIAAMVGIYNGIDAYIAKAADVAVLEARITNHILSERLQALQERLWKLQDRWSDQFYGEHLRYPASMDELYAWMPEVARKQLRELEKEIASLEAELREGQ